MVGNLIIGSLGVGFKVDGGLISLKRSRPSAERDSRKRKRCNGVFGGLAETLEIAPNDCGVDTVCP